MSISAIFSLLGELCQKFFKWLWKSFAWLFLLMFVIDITTKQLIKNFMNVGDEIILIPNFLSIHYVENNGMAFGLNFGDDLANTIFFISISIIGFIIIAGCMIYYRKKIHGVGLASGMLMLSGCFGNLIDRAFYTGQTPSTINQHVVVDWIGFFGSDPGFARFNIADSCLVIGTIMLIIWLFVEEFKANKQKKLQQEKISLTTTNNKVEQDEIKNTINENNKEDVVIDNTKKDNKNE